MNTPAPTPTPAPAAAPGTFRLADISDDQIFGMIERAATDPFVAQEVQRLQKQAFDTMAAAIQSMLAELTEFEPELAAASKSPMTVVQMQSAARQREAASKQKREFAESLIIGALINRDNPDWSIFDETETAAPSRSGLLALLQMQPPSSSTGGASA